MTVDADLNRVQERLHDAGAIWPRAELLRSLNDGYRELLAMSHAVRRWRLMDLPGRTTYAISYEWEDRYAASGTVRKPTRTIGAGWAQGTALWEAEHLAGVTPSTTLAGFTQEWERAHMGETDRHYRFVLPRNHERIARVTWNERLLLPVSVRELDETDVAWARRTGEPRWWTTGVGRIKSIEVYEIVTTYGQAYDLRDPERGLPRRLTGDRSYAVTAGTVANAYAYTTSGEGQALTTPAAPFAPASAYCYLWESVYAVAPSWNFTINYLMNEPTLQHVVVHPWALGVLPVGEQHPLLADDAATPGKRGMFAWEHHDADGGYAAKTPTPDGAPAITGPGARVTTAATNAAQGFGTQVWEAEHMNGATAFTTGVKQPCFSWESQHGAAVLALGLGGIRAVVSPDRQYLGMTGDPTQATLLGGIRDWRSSTDSLAILEVVVPDAALPDDDSIPALIPTPLTKYLRYYTLARAFGRVGEGHNTILADHYTRRFLRGVAFFRRLADVAHRDRVFQREMVVPPSRRIARVSLPAEYPAVWR